MRTRRANSLSVALFLKWALVFEVAIAADRTPAVIVAPESPTSLEMSNRDINRIVCTNGVFEDYRYSGEKGIIVEAVGGDAFVKYQIIEEGAARKFVTVRSEFFFKCGGQMYTIFATPRDIASQTIFLGSPRAKAAEANLRIFNPLSDEERVVAISLQILSDTVPSTFSRVLLEEEYQAGLIPGADVRRLSHTHLEGIGLSAAEFQIRATRPMVLDEVMFADRRFGRSIYGITLETPQLKAGETTRVVLVYRGSER